MSRISIRTESVKERLPDIVAYGAAIFVSILISAVVLDLRHANLTVPFDYGGSDSYTFMQAFKDIGETGSVDANLRIDAPLQAGFQRDPQILYLPILFVRFLFLFFHDFGAVLNAYFLLGFPLTAVCALYALRTIGFSYFAAFVPALLYAFLPYHMFRGEHHLLIGAYFVVPLAILVAFWIAGGRPLFRRRSGTWLPSVSREGALAILFCVVLGSYHPYYAFFALFVFLLAAAYGSVAFNLWQGVADGAVTIGITLGAFALNVAGYVISKGTALPAAWSRSPAEGEIFGLKFIQLLLPIPAHRIAELAQFRQYYAATAPLVNENGMASLGSVGSIGLLLLLVVLLLPFRTKPNDVLKQSAVLAGGCFLLATIGGLGSLFNYLVIPDVRAYNRISVYIAFFSLVAVAWLLEKARERWVRNLLGRRISVGALALLLVLGVADQSSPAMVPNYAANAAEYRSDRAFVQTIESSLPPGSAVFELPYTLYPDSEELVPAGTSPYWMFKGYLHSNGLRWSYGALKGSDDDAWLRALSSLPVAKLLPKLVVAGFDGIYIERPLYADQAAERTLESDLSRALLEAPPAGADGTQAFFSLDGVRKAEMSRSGAEFARARALMPPLFLRVVSGCQETQRSPGHAWRWCGKRAVLAIDNLTAVTKRGVLEGVIGSASGVSGAIDVHPRLGSGRLGVSSKQQPMRIEVTAPPGISLVDFDATLLPASAMNGSSYFFLDLELFDAETGDATDFYSFRI
jgi:phosphoglycerol transferase